MPIVDPAFLSEVSTWHGQNRANLAEHGVDLRIIGPTFGRSKNSAAVEFAAPGRVLTATFWDSGECEVISAVMDDPTVTVDELLDPAELVARLDRISSELAGA